jgi:hypothetical protein
MRRKWSKEFEISVGEELQRAKNDPAVQKWWDEEQVQLDLGLVQGEGDSGIQWDELSDDHKRELILKIQAVSPSGVSYKKYGRFHADAYAHRLWRTLGDKSVFGVVDEEQARKHEEGLELKKELRKLGCIDPPGTILHKGRRLWKDLDQWEKMDVAGKYLIMKGDKVLDAQKVELEKAKKKLEKLKKLENVEKSAVGLVAGLLGLGLGLAGLAKRKAK